MFSKSARLLMLRSAISPPALPSGLRFLNGVQIASTIMASWPMILHSSM